VSRAAATDNIFISYRRDDAAAYAGRIADHFGARIGASRVFMDVEDIRPGQNFAEAIDRTLAQCSTVLVVLGPRWFDILRQCEATSEQLFMKSSQRTSTDQKRAVRRIDVIYIT
jgi:hypothetical protein